MKQITLKAARVDAGITQKELATTLGKDESTIVRWEKDPTKIPMGDFIKLCNVIKINMDQIFLGTKSS